MVVLLVVGFVFVGDFLAVAFGLDGVFLVLESVVFMEDLVFFFCAVAVTVVFFVVDLGFVVLLVVVFLTTFFRVILFVVVGFDFVFSLGKKLFIKLSAFNCPEKS